MTAHIRTMTQVWLGHLALGTAIRQRALLLEGGGAEVQAFSRWFRVSALAVHDCNGLCGETDDPSPPGGRTAPVGLARQGGS